MTTTFCCLVSYSVGETSCDRLFLVNALRWAGLNYQYLTGCFGSARENSCYFRRAYFGPGRSYFTRKIRD